MSPIQLALGDDTSSPILSIDASAMINLNCYYPRDVFRSVWDFLDGLAEAGRLLACEQIVRECHDEPLKAFFHAHTK